jgi:hypothetical protein
MQSETNTAPETVNLTPDGVENLLPDEGDEPAAPGGRGKRTKRQREEDLAEIEKYLHKRMSLRAIAAHINATRDYKIGERQIGYDAKCIALRQGNRHLMPTNTARGMQLAFLESLEREAIDAWDRSRQDSEIQRREYEIGPDGKLKPNPTKVVIEKHRRDGNPAFLKVMLLAQDLKARILGTYSPARAAVEVSTAVNSKANLEALRTAFRKRVIAEVTAEQALKALAPAAVKNQ